MPELEKAEWGRTKSAAEKFGLSRSGIYRLLADQKIQARKVGGCLLVDLASVRKFIETHPHAVIGAKGRQPE